MSLFSKESLEYWSSGLLIWVRKLLEQNDHKAKVGGTIGDLIKMKEKEFEVLYLHVRYEYLKRKRSKK